MKISCLCENLYSHPGKLLEDHLCNVGKTAQDWISSRKLNFDVDKSVLADIACIIGFAHDLGKSTGSFQKYLLTEDEEEKLRLKNHEETRHSPLGAFCGFYLTREFLRSNRINAEYEEYLPIAAFLVIQRHHGDLTPIISETTKSKAEKIVAYLQDIDEKLFDKLLSATIGRVPSLEHCNYKWLQENVENFEADMRVVRSFARIIGRRKKLDFYFITSLLYSTLVDADKSDAAAINIDLSSNIIPGDLVDEYRKIRGYDRPETEMDCIRNGIYVASANVTKAIEKSNHILSINVPTGTGKTLAALSVAIKIREHLLSMDQIDRSIIYTLPFTSIIDQNYQVFDDVLKTVCSKEPGNDILLKHHYLADSFYRTSEQSDEYLIYSALESRFIIEGWNSSIIVTTFVQLFHSLITNRNSSARKLHRIANSIIILDEVQAIPHRYWHLLRQICNYMARCMDTYFILVTATLPLIFPEEEIYEIISDKKFYYNALNRIKLETHINKIIEIEDFNEIVLKEACTNSQKDILIVMNTVKSAQIIYETLISELDAEKNTFYYLSSHVVPIERKDRIKRIRKKQNKRKIVVSTQLIEAGVDIDLDIVFRDMGPLDSVNQVAGRCNRNLNPNKGRGVVKLYYIKRSNKPDSSYIYDSTLLNATQQIINEYTIDGDIEEKNFYDMSNSYYELLNQNILSDTESQNALEAVFSLNYEKIREFKLIDENYEKVDIFVEIDEKAKQTWERFLGLSSIDDRWQRRENFFEFKNTFQQYIISVQKNVKWLLPFTDDMAGGIFHINLDIVDTYYKSEGKGDIGFKTEGDTYAMW